MIFLILLSLGNIHSQSNILTSQEYSNIKFDNVLLEDIINTSGNTASMQNLFNNILTVETGYNEAIDYWIKFNANSICIEFYHGQSNSSEITYDLASIKVENNTSSLKIKGEVISIGDNANILSSSQIRTYGNKKMMLFRKENFDSYIYVYIDPTSNLITEIGYNGNLL